MIKKDRIDCEMTPMRIVVKELQEKLGIGATGECFDCASFSTRCKPSIVSRMGTVPVSAGDWTYVGHEFGQATIRGRLARILFVSMERPKSNKQPESFEDTQRAFRKACFARSNPHMGGTDIELEAILDPTTPAENRCRQFALTNSVRCRPVSNRANSRSTPTMIAECQQHTKAIIKKLKPNVIVTQGKPAYQSIRSLYKSEVVCRRDNGRLGRSFRFAEVRKNDCMLILRTAHPAHHVEFSTKLGPAPPYLLDAINFLRNVYAT